ncbi:MAG: hypothetical protein KA034_02045, partial [Candidatus Moranbacteria bacterium]|nr:hypothetical protein [Candidatus Moranbacteria bacterium]
WLFDRYFVCDGDRLDGRENSFLITSLGFVWLGENGNDMVFVLDQRLQKGGCEIGRSHEDNPDFWT